MIVSATATVTAPSNGQFLTAYVGFLQGTVTLGTANSNQLTAAVYVASLTSPTFAAQPFGGSGLSGTGPKAGGPNYLKRFAVEQVVCINTAAAGGNASLMTIG